MHKFPNPERLKPWRNVKNGSKDTKKRVFLQQKSNQPTNRHDICTVYRRLPRGWERGCTSFRIQNDWNHEEMWIKARRTRKSVFFCNKRATNPPTGTIFFVPFTIDYLEDEKGDAQVSESRTIETMEKCDKSLKRTRKSVFSCNKRATNPPTGFWVPLAITFAEQAAALFRLHTGLCLIVVVLLHLPASDLDAGQIQDLPFSFGISMVVSAGLAWRQAKHTTHHTGLVLLVGQ
jgi:hypothetical protein